QVAHRQKPRSILVLAGAGLGEDDVPPFFPALGAVGRGRGATEGGGVAVRAGAASTPPSVGSGPGDAAAAFVLGGLAEASGVAFSLAACAVAIASTAGGAGLGWAVVAGGGSSAARPGGGSARLCREATISAAPIAP